MKLAEALQERADLARQIDRLAGRLNLNVIYQEGEKPAEDPKELFKELDAASDRLRELIGRINSTNCQTVCDGKTLTQMIADKDVLVKKLACYKNVAMSASQTAARARFLAAFSMHDIRRSSTIVNGGDQYQYQQSTTNNQQSIIRNQK